MTDTLADAQPELQGWQPIETAPKDKLLVGYEGGMTRLILWEDHCWKQVGTVIDRNWFEPTHWMPLPERRWRRCCLILLLHMARDRR